MFKNLDTLVEESKELDRIKSIPSSNQKKSLEKWAKIGKDTKQSLLQSYDLLRDILLYKNKLFDYVYINGETVKKQLESVLNITISEIRKISIHGKTHSLYKYVLPNGCVLIGNSFYLQQALNNEDRNTLKQQTKSIM